LTEGVAELLVAVGFVLWVLILPALLLEGGSEGAGLGDKGEHVRLHSVQDQSEGASVDHGGDSISDVGLIFDLGGAVSVKILHNVLEVAFIEVLEHKVASRVPGLFVLVDANVPVVRDHVVAEFLKLVDIFNDPLAKAFLAGLGDHTLSVDIVETTVEALPQMVAEEHLLCEISLVVLLLVGGEQAVGENLLGLSLRLGVECVVKLSLISLDDGSWEVRLRRKGGKILPALATFLAATRESGEQSRRDTRRSGAGGCKGGEK